MVEGARLEIVYAEMYRRFESSRFRQRQNVILASLLAIFNAVVYDMAAV